MDILNNAAFFPRLTHQIEQQKKSKSKSKEMRTWSTENSAQILRQQRRGRMHNVPHYDQDPNNESMAYLPYEQRVQRPSAVELERGMRGVCPALVAPSPNASMEVQPPESRRRRFSFSSFTAPTTSNRAEALALGRDGARNPASRVTRLRSPRLVLLERSRSSPPPPSRPFHVGHQHEEERIRAEDDLPLPPRESVCTRLKKCLMQLRDARTIEVDHAGEKRTVLRKKSMTRPKPRKPPKEEYWEDEERKSHNSSASSLASMMTIESVKPVLISIPSKSSREKAERNGEDAWQRMHAALLDEGLHRLSKDLERAGIDERTYTYLDPRMRLRRGMEQPRSRSPIMPYERAVEPATYILTSEGPIAGPRGFVELKFSEDRFYPKHLRILPPSGEPSPVASPVKDPLIKETRKHRSVKGSTESSSQQASTKH